MRKDKLVSEVLGEETTLTPSDLYNTDFKTAIMGGYDKLEVDAFLERVADHLESLIHEVRDLKERNEEQRAQLEQFKEMEGTLRNALASSAKFSENVIDSARREAAAIIEEARLERLRAEIESRDLPEAIEKEIRQLRETRDHLRNSLQAVLEAHKILLERIPFAEEALHKAAAKAASAQAAVTAPVGPAPAGPAQPLSVERDPSKAGQAPDEDDAEQEEEEEEIV